MIQQPILVLAVLEQGAKRGLNMSIDQGVVTQQVKGARPVDGFGDPWRLVQAQASDLCGGLGHLLGQTSAPHRELSDE